MKTALKTTLNQEAARRFVQEDLTNRHTDVHGIIDIRDISITAIEQFESGFVGEVEILKNVGWVYLDTIYELNELAAAFAVVELNATPTEGFYFLAGRLFAEIRPEETSMALRAMNFISSLRGTWI